MSEAKLMTADELLRLKLPDKRTRIYRADGSATLLGEDDALEGEDLLSGFRCPVPDLW